jgi:hypothetical protein
MIRRLRFDNPWRLLWRGATSDKLLACVLLALALALFLAAWLPQTSVDQLNSDLAWQAEVQRRFGELAWFEAIRTPLETIGAFYVADALGFRLLLALLALALLARLVDSVEKLWRGWRAYASLRGTRRDKHPIWGDLGSVAVYLGGSVILLGAAITDLGGWRIGPLAVAPGESIPLNQNGDLTFHLESLGADGQHGVGELWHGAETRLGMGDLAVGQPLTGGGIGVYLVGSGSGLQVQAMSSDGQPLQLITGANAAPMEQAVIALTEEMPRHLVGIPEANLVLMLTMPQVEQTNALAQVQIFEEGSGEFVLEQEISDETIIPVKDVNLALIPIPYARVQLVHDRGAFWIQVGVIGLIIGAILRGFWSRHRTKSTAPSDSLGLRDDTDPPVAPETSLPGADRSDISVV